MQWSKKSKDGKSMIFMVYSMINTFTPKIIYYQGRMQDFSKGGGGGGGGVEVSARQ